jgi:D-glycero-D-manno-heptose 1,7-bisphosphate phosphatase
VPAIGDSLRDLQAASALGCAPILVRTGKGEKTEADGNLPAGTVVRADLAAAVDALLGKPSKKD